MIAIVVLGAMHAPLAGGEEATPKFKITAKRDNDKVDVRVEPGEAIFSVHSPFGISEANVERLGPNWPARVVVRLHLKGLEHFRASNGHVVLEASASITSSGVQEIRLWKDGNEAAPLDATSPFWTKIRAIGDDGKLARKIPLERGFFQIELPTQFFAGNPRSIQFNWIDFYRN
jgi:hypothetical protein